MNFKYKMDKKILYARKEESSPLTRDEYVNLAKKICTRYWIMDSKEIDYKKPICNNCGPGGVEDCVTFGDSKLTSILVL